MTRKEYLIAKKLITAIESIEYLVEDNPNRVFYVSHLTQLSRLQRDVLAEVFVDMGFIEAIHSGSRSPYRIIVTKSQWTKFVDTMKNWALVAAGTLPKSVPDSLFDLEIKEKMTFNLRIEDIIYFSRLFGQTRVSVASKGIIANTLSEIAPNGLTVEEITNKLKLSRRTVNDYLKEGFKDGFYAVCFPKDTLQSVGYRTLSNADSLLEAWKNIISLIPSPVISIAKTAETASVAGE